MAEHDGLLAVRPGMRPKFKSSDGTVRHGIVKRIDDSRFPEIVVMRGEDGETYEVPIHIGLPD